VKFVAWVGGAVIVAGLVVLAVAGITGATAILVTVTALVAMIGLGSMLGGRHTPNVPPMPSGSGVAGSGAGTVPAHDGAAQETATDGAEGAATQP